MKKFLNWFRLVRRLRWERDLYLSRGDEFARYAQAWLDKHDQISLEARQLAGIVATWNSYRSLFRG